MGNKLPFFDSFTNAHGSTFLRPKGLVNTAIKHLQHNKAEDIDDAHVHRLIESTVKTFFTADDVGKVKPFVDEILAQVKKNPMSEKEISSSVKGLFNATGLSRAGIKIEDARIGDYNYLTKLLRPIGYKGLEKQTKAELLKDQGVAIA